MVLTVMMVFGLTWLQNRINIRKAGGVPVTGAPMPKLVFDYE
jgi:hypothetical protein